jgi:hypothetical protein
MKTFRTCLIIFLAVAASLILLIVLLFVGGGIYGQWRMAQVTQDLAVLARELGYTPDAHLHHRIAVRDVSIITGSAYCEAKLYFTTPMSLSEFTERLNQLESETINSRLQNMISYLPGLVPGLTVHATEVQTTTPPSQREPPMMYHWILRDRNYITLVWFYDTTNLYASIEHGSKEITDNIIEINLEGGVFPFWMDCPGTFRDAPEAPFD